METLLGTCSRICFEDGARGSERYANLRVSGSPIGIRSEQETEPRIRQNYRVRRECFCCCVPVVKFIQMAKEVLRSKFEILTREEKRHQSDRWTTTEEGEN